MCILGRLCSVLFHPNWQPKKWIKFATRQLYPEPMYCFLIMQHLSWSSKLHLIISTSSAAGRLQLTEMFWSVRIRTSGLADWQTCSGFRKTELSYCHISRYRMMPFPTRCLNAVSHSDGLVCLCVCVCSPDRLCWQQRAASARPVETSCAILERVRQTRGSR